jgi:hypothetical protein
MAVAGDDDPESDTGDDWSDEDDEDDVDKEDMVALALALKEVVGEFVMGLGVEGLEEEVFSTVPVFTVVVGDVCGGGGGGGGGCPDSVVLEVACRLSAIEQMEVI